jgi:uncharacterized protein (TIGR00255 family)
MIKSMTGYGTATIQDASCSQVWEIKSVNSKQLSLRWKLPHALSPMEHTWESEIRSVAIRGKVDVFLQLQFLQSDLLPISLNRLSAEAMICQLRDFAKDRGETFQPDFNRLLNIPGLWQESANSLDSRVMQPLQEGLHRVLHVWDASRIQEGKALQKDLLARLQEIHNRIGELETRAQDLSEQKFQSLQDRLQSLLEAQGLAVDTGSLWQEMAILADKLDVSEELVRLTTHITTLRHLLETEQGGGRKLDFYLQECFREITTCGNKAQDAQVSQLVVECKTELEKCREQVQNLE